MAEELESTTCTVCNRAIYVKDGPVCVNCRKDEKVTPKSGATSTTLPSAETIPS